MLKQTVQLKVGQQLTMTPALQQAIRLLQLSSLELRKEVQEQLDENIMLELDEADVRDQSKSEQRDDAERATEKNSSADSTTDNLPDELAVDTRWEDSYDMVKRPSSSADLPDAGALGEGPASLNSHLLEQLQFERFSDRDRVIALTLIDSLDGDGYIQESDDDLLATLRLEFPLEPIEPDELESVMHRIQHFDPLGVCCRNLEESLRVQLLALPTSTPFFAEASTLLNKHFSLLANRDYVAIGRKLKLDDEELGFVMTLIRSLDPRPGSQFSNERIDYIAPDVTIYRDANNIWRARLIGDSTPRLRVNATYEKLAQSSSASSADRDTMRNHLQEARWFIKSLESRNDTLFKVANCIVERQQQFFEEGEVAMKPMVLRDVAEAVEMHESTISRVTTRKYMHTPFGVLEFKYFFSSHVGTSDGGECSATAIQSMIKTLVANEPPRKPLSDAKIAAHLEEKGINVARRTVAKYREALNIASSSERKRVA